MLNREKKIALFVIAVVVTVVLLLILFWPTWLGEKAPQSIWAELHRQGV